MVYNLRPEVFSVPLVLEQHIKNFRSCIQNGCVLPLNRISRKKKNTRPGTAPYSSLQDVKRLRAFSPCRIKSLQINRSTEGAPSSTLIAPASGLLWNCKCSNSACEVRVQFTTASDKEDFKVWTRILVSREGFEETFCTK